MTTPATTEQRQARNAEVLRDLQAHSGRTEAGQTLVVLTTVGQQTGREYRLPLCVREDGADLVIAASAGGQQDHPDWYRRLLARPGVVVEYLGRTYPAVASTVPNGPERDRLFALLSEEIIGLYSYQDRCRDRRQIPVVRLRPVDGSE
jgi:deazaflavin-dependent oxidoreductase (nitroreductase family)